MSRRNSNITIMIPQDVKAELKGDDPLYEYQDVDIRAVITAKLDDQKIHYQAVEFNSMGWNGENRTKRINSVLMITNEVESIMILPAISETVSEARVGLKIDVKAAMDAVLTRGYDFSKSLQILFPYGAAGGTHWNAGEVILSSQHNSEGKRIIKARAYDPYGHIKSVINDGSFSEVVVDEIIVNVMKCLGMDEKNWMDQIIFDEESAALPMVQQRGDESKEGDSTSCGAYTSHALVNLVNKKHVWDGLKDEDKIVGARSLRKKQHQELLKADAKQNQASFAAEPKIQILKNDQESVISAVTDHSAGYIEELKSPEAQSKIPSPSPQATEFYDFNTVKTQYGFWKDSSKGNNFRTLKNIFSSNEKTRLQQVEDLMVAIVISIAKDINGLTKENLIKIIQDAKTDGGVKHRAEYDEDKKEHKYYANKHPDKKIEKEISSKYQKICKSCGIYAESDKSNEGNRLTFFTDGALQKLQELTQMNVEESTKKVVLAKRRVLMEKEKQNEGR